jgi:hypothetical protein
LYYFTTVYCRIRLSSKCQNSKQHLKQLKLINNQPLFHFQVN